MTTVATLKGNEAVEVVTAGHLTQGTGMNGEESTAGVAAVEAPSTKPCPECSGGSPGLVDDGSGGFATCEECGGTGRVPLGVDLPDGAKHG